MALIVVESPTKARTFNRILGEQKYFVFATMGHIRDLPGNKLSIDYTKNFKPNYTIIKKKENVVSELKKLAEKNNEIIFATDPDREGESIAYHVAYVLGLAKEKWPEISLDPKIKLKRIIFHEITETALREALKNPQSIRLDLVKAQQARRILDRIVGYELSPLLWKKIGKNWLSAGRVQTVALRLIVEREKEIAAFKVATYFQIYADFVNHTKIEKAKLVSKDGVSYDQKFSVALFTGIYQYTKTTIDKQNKDKILDELKNDTYKVESVSESVQTRNPPPPYTTSLLQQDGFYKYGFSSKMTMRLAQDLYEAGLITYHRTDSYNMSPNFLTIAKNYIIATYGQKYALEDPRFYKTKSKMAQEAHEAIRPTKLEGGADGVSVSGKITHQHKKLYKIIFERALATQMAEAVIKTMKISILSSKGYLFETQLQNVLFDGFLRLLNPEFVQKNHLTSDLKKDDVVKLTKLDPEETATKPPPRFNDASLIKTLEEKGIGRPSTYAPIISLIQEKNYTEKENKVFIPTKLGTVVSDYLAGAFPKLFGLDFTAKMEEELDEIASGQFDMQKLLSEFNEPFQKDLKKRREDKQVIDVEEEVDEICPKCSGKLVIRYSRFGKFMACSNFPKCKFTKPFLKFVENKKCPEDDARIVVRYTKSRRRFYGCENYPKCQFRSWKLPDEEKTKNADEKLLTTDDKT